MYATHVVFDRGKYGVERYRINPQCVIMEYYTGGVNRLFPTLIPTYDFEWWNPNPRDPTTGKISWHTPEVEQAAYQGQSYTGLARAMNQQAGIKKNKIMELVPLIVLGVVIIIGFVVYTGMAGLQVQLAGMQEQINLLR